MDRRAVLRQGLTGGLAALAAGSFLLSTGRAGAPLVELVYVREVGCPWCRMFDERIAPAYPRTPEGQRAPLREIYKRDAALKAYRLVSPVIYSPTFILVSDGVELGRIEGYPGEDFFWGRLARLLERLPAP
jgi:hypothetical protein